VQADTNAPVFATGEVEVAADPETVWAVMADTGLARLKAEAERRTLR
jgi:hypothetical protein